MSNNPVPSTSGLKRSLTMEDETKDCKKIKCEVIPFAPFTRCAPTLTTDSVITTSTPAAVIIISPAQRHGNIIAIMRAMYENFKLE